MTQKSYDEIVSQFEAITIDNLDQKIQSSEKTVAYLGRKTCPYCNHFVGNLGPIQEKTGAKVYYVDTEGKETSEDINNFRNKYGIVTVPGFIASENGNIHVKTDSKMKELEISDFLTESLTYKQDIANFNFSQVEDIEEKIKNGDELILYVGKNICPYCRRFVKKLAKVQKEENWEIYAINSIDESQEEAIETFRNKYDMPTVPSFLYSNEGQTKVKSDSSMTEEEIRAFIQ